MNIAERMRTLLHRDGTHTQPTHDAAAQTPVATEPSPTTTPLTTSLATTSLTVDAQVRTLADLGIALREQHTVPVIAAEIEQATRRELEADPRTDEPAETTPPVPGLQRSPFWWLLHERIDGRYVLQGRHRVLPPRADLFGDRGPDAEQLTRSIHKVAQRLCSDTGARLPEIEVRDLQVRSQLLTTATVRLDGVAHAWSDVRDRDFVRTLAEACSTSENTIMVFDDHGADTHWTRPMVDVLVVPTPQVEAVADLLARHIRPAVRAAHTWIDLPYSGRHEKSPGRISELRPRRRRGSRVTPWAPPALVHRAA
ncbi:hypothetical protein [Brachybacterium endophyticum]|uniref:hypothetical protein n=1 Tax=Brachybacterium endophyticum TaxID=2182385 RepID=UPI0014025C08|nr:hypothetical protein [Brachybacterium endophyticum]